MNNRIDRIDGNKYYEYTKIKNLNVSDADEKFSLDYKQDNLPTEEKEKKDKAASEQKAGQSPEHNGVRLEISRSGRTASRDNRPQTAMAGKRAQTQTTPASLLASVRKIVTTAIAAVKDFLYKVWNDPQPEAVGQEILDKEADRQGISGKEAFHQEIAGAPETAGAQGAEAQGAAQLAADLQTAPEFHTGMPDGTAQDAASAYHRYGERLDREIQPYLRSGDLNQVISLLTDNGKKTIARNSTLLTYYDRNGRMIEPNASDRERILYGDRNTRKL